MTISDCVFNVIEIETIPVNGHIMASVGSLSIIMDNHILIILAG